MNIDPGVFQLKMIDLVRTGWLPDNWQNQVTHVGAHFSVETLLDGKSSTSRETGELPPALVRVVEGDSVLTHLPWLMNLYSGKLLQWSEALTGRKLVPAVDVRSSVNLNVLSGIGGRYEKHIDSNPVTGLLFISSLEPEDGGALVFQHPSGQFDRIIPRAGLFLAFDGSDTLHWVDPLKRDIIRVSAVMNYYHEGSPQARPKGLDDYLYARRTPG